MTKVSLIFVFEDVRLRPLSQSGTGDNQQFMKDNNKPEHYSMEIKMVHVWQQEFMCNNIIVLIYEFSKYAWDLGLRDVRAQFSSY